MGDYDGGGFDDRDRLCESVDPDSDGHYTRESVDPDRTARDHFRDSQHHRGVPMTS